jgi:hypothetical protein
VNIINSPFFGTELKSLKILTHKILSKRFLPLKGIAFLILMVLSAVVLKAQPGSGDDPYNEEADSNNYDYYDENIDGNDYQYDDYDDLYGDNKKKDEPKKPERKPYVRIKVPVDTITELITYEDVVIQDESYYDSLYIRAKRWIHTKWGVPFATKRRDKKDNEELYVDDVLYEKFKVKVTKPLVVRYNKYSKSEYGKLQFTITMRFKDGKYKYTITNLTHILPETSIQKDINYVYMEFYMKSERNIRKYDQFLRAADGSIQLLVKDMRKFMREPPEIDEDDW